MDNNNTIVRFDEGTQFVRDNITYEVVSHHAGPGSNIVHLCIDVYGNSPPARLHGSDIAGDVELFTSRGSNSDGTQPDEVGELSLQEEANTNNNMNKEGLSLNESDNNEIGSNQSTIIPLQGMGMANIITQAPGRSLTSSTAAVDDNNITSNYDGLLDRAPAMPTVGSEKHDSVYIALMVKYFYEYMRLIGSFTPEQNKIVDDLAGDYDEQTFQKYLQITGKDISNP